MIKIIKYVIKEIKQNGLAHCWKQLNIRIYNFVCPIIGIIVYPFCLITNIRFINVYTNRIGHLCVEPDCYIKEEILGLHPKYHAIILAPRNKTANTHIIKYWKKYFKIITNSLLCTLLDPLSKNKFTIYDIHKYAQVINENAAYTKIQKEYFGHPPLLFLEKSDYEHGWNILQNLGLPRDAWFVCLHVREDGYKPREQQLYRNVDIKNYFLAIKTITDKGGWVIRIGDSSMEYIPDIYHVIDYAHLNIKSDHMDVFLCASCKFFIGSASGLITLSNIFNIPAISTNNAPLGVILPYAPRDIGIPKLIFSTKENRLLTFKEIFDSQISHYRFDSLYLEANIKTIENSPEDINELTLELIEITDGTILYTDKDEQLQNAFKSLMNSSHYSYGAVSRVGRTFLKKHSFLLN